MGMPCTVCAHPARGIIDQRLAVQVVNVKQLAAEYGLGRDAVARHRSKHLPLFLPAFQAQADALTLGQLGAEAQRLYLLSLDALAQAEAGVLVALDDHGAEVRKVSSTAVARLLREARASLGMLAKLAADGQAPVEAAAKHDEALDARIAAVLERAVSRTQTALDVEAADVVEPPRAVVEDPLAGGGGDPHPGTWSGRHPRVHGDGGVPSDSAEPSEWISPRERVFAEAKRQGIPLSPAYSDEELKAAGFDLRDYSSSTASDAGHTQSGIAT
jgi:hypothetical protein